MNRRNFCAVLTALGAFFGAKRIITAYEPVIPQTVAVRDDKVKVSRVYAWAGETVTCENGHPICVFHETVFIGTIQNPAKDLGDWRIEPPEVGTKEENIKCHCGARWALSGGIFHIGDEWRDPFGVMNL